jgi:hypothetical protein
MFQEQPLQHRLVGAAGQGLVLALLALPALLGGDLPPLAQQVGVFSAAATSPALVRTNQAPSAPPLRVAGLVLSEKHSPTPVQPVQSARRAGADEHGHRR